MTTHHRVTPALIRGILGAPERHGYYRSDDLHADRAIGFPGGLARIWEGAQGRPAIAYPRTMPSSPAAYPGPGRRGAVTLTRDDVSTVFATPDIAADDKRYRAETRPSCPGQSCQTRLRDARAFDQIAAHTLQAAQAVPAASASQPPPDRRAQPATGREAGQ
jgi:hypothetical protein